MKDKKENFVIFGLSNSIELAKKISIKADLPFGEFKFSRFADGEILFDIKNSVRGKEVFVVQSTSNPVNESIMELLIFIDTLRRSSTKEINVIMPYYGYSRQDRKNKGRQPITAAIVARILESSGADRIITFDLHSSQIQGFFNIPVDELKALGILGKELKKITNVKDDFIVVSPDHGGVSRARMLANLLDVPLAIMDKRRNKPNSAEILNVIGDVKNKNCVIIDDMIDTGNTILETFKKLKEENVKKVFLLTTHAVFSSKNKIENEVIKKLYEQEIVEKIIITNSISINIPNKYKDKFIVCDLSDSISGVIENLISGKSITDYFIKKYNTVL